MPVLRDTSPIQYKSMHRVGVICGLAAGAWLGAAEAPNKLAAANTSPFVISLCMVAGVFVARWTIPSLLRGNSFVWRDLRAKKHLMVWGVLAGALWAVANTLTVFAIRNVGLAIAFPLWNTNCLVGVFWGWLLFRELRGASLGNWLKVLGGTVAILLAAVLLAFTSMHGHVVAAGGRAIPGILAAVGASLLWGTMYVPYRKAYLSGMNPLSFVTVFTVGELGAMGLLALALSGGAHAVLAELRAARGVIFWLFLGGFCWVLGDLFQQYATKYIGIGRAIPLSNTNQLWGLAWGALVFGELAHAAPQQRWLVLAASLVMLLGALGISASVAGGAERTSTHRAIVRECDRYRLALPEVLAAQTGVESRDAGAMRRCWWDYGVAIAAFGIFVWLGMQARLPAVAMHPGWTAWLLALLLLTLLGGGWWLWRTTRFS